MIFNKETKVVNTSENNSRNFQQRKASHRFSLNPEDKY